MKTLWAQKMRELSAKFKLPDDPEFQATFEWELQMAYSKGYEIGMFDARASKVLK